ncbi:DUF4357 domain-containing protein [Streptomyces sp. H51]|uniref:restriction system modified-DNA reader domain-containing protein n=1 Tax=Streptomyces sp. H51 TaxID=3111770 RepID=UPI002D76DDC0|nr:DUF4357 domain-containing protein [Streptomyces sp. H51]
MTLRKIDVDDEVYAHLEQAATPLVDTPNSVLRRLLGLDRDTATTKPNQHSPLATLVTSGRLSVGQRLVWHRRNYNKTHLAVVTADGRLRLEDGTTHKSPSGACGAISGIAINGWSAWRTEDGTPLQALRNP